ncbi:hypothetical protein BDF14DRAFT_1884209 [Spinellus fusiger]|nr:hypothetical protein BDF14DRAFT_1884209 [Spinellus fusiger]
MSLPVESTENTPTLTETLSLLENSDPTLHHPSLHQRQHPLHYPSSHTSGTMEATTNECSDEAMDMFLSQVAEYNAHHIQYTKLTTHQESMGIDPSHLIAPLPAKVKHELDPYDLTLHPLNDPQFIEFSAPLHSVASDLPSLHPPKEEEQQLEEQEPKEKIIKKKDTGSGHSSLLNVFVNPLLHAIPLLARNCLNFEDFLAQTALQGPLGPKEDEPSLYGVSNKFVIDKSIDISTERSTEKSTEKSIDTSAERSMNRSIERSIIAKADPPWQIRVLGLPLTGAKSRVETQIKLCLQLVNPSGDRSSHWPTLYLPEHLVAKEKLKRKLPKPTEDPLGARDKGMVEADALFLEAAVVCDSHADKEIIMCASCVHRERKRLKRKRDNKAARAANKESSAAKLAALFANDLPDLKDEEVMNQERRKILLFNCGETVDFMSGEATLPTRVTCYCRHHNEKVGFRIVFTIKDRHHHVIATGRSPPIMITDDHKSSKIQTALRKRMRAEIEPPLLEEALDPKRKASIMAYAHQEVETDSGVSSPIASTPATPTTPSSQLEEILPSPEATPFDREPSRHEEDHSTVRMATDLSIRSSTFYETLPSEHDVYDFMGQYPMQQVQQQQQQQQQHYHPQHPQHPHLQSLPSSLPSQMDPQTHPLLPAEQHQQQILSHFQNIQSPLRRRMTGTYNMQQQWQASNIYAKMQQRHAVEESKPNVIPRLHRLIPSEGPIYGGAEVTVLGSNFYEGLTCLFGENPAVPTHCWSSNTLLCILPPAPTAGPVVVSFREHPLMSEGQDVVLFTYFDESDRALMELALQVVGLKTMGKVEDARHIAMRIVQGDPPQDRKDAPSGFFQPSPHSLSDVYDCAKQLYLSDLEEMVMNALLSMHQVHSLTKEVSLTNRYQHTLLHLATLCGYHRLVKLLVYLGVDVNQVDRNGFTALHFASWTGKEDIVRILKDTTDPTIRNRMGKTAEGLAMEAGHQHVASLLKRTVCAGRLCVDSSRPDSLCASTRTTRSVPHHSRRPTSKHSNIESLLDDLSIYPSCIKRWKESVGQVYSFLLSLT